GRQRSVTSPCGARSCPSSLAVYRRSFISKPLIAVRAAFSFSLRLACPATPGDGATEAPARKGDTAVKTIKNYEIKIRRLAVGEAPEPYGQAITSAEDVR